MEKIKKVHTPIIQERFIKKFCGYFWNIYGGCLDIGYTHSTNREEYYVLEFTHRTASECFNLLSKILKKDISNRIIDRKYTDMKEIHITNEEFLELYNHLVIKDETKYLSSIKSLYYKDLKHLYNYIDYCTADTPQDIKQSCMEMEDTISKLVDNCFVHYYIAVNKEKTEAALYVEADKKLALTKATKRLEDLLHFPNKPISYISGKDTFLRKDVLVKQFNFSIEYLYTIYVYLKLLPSTK